jgi:pyruvate dehydrogenase E2 component (dihydrolipoamide acetyltransferase)
VDEVNGKKGTSTPVTVQHVLFKAAALAMRKVPTANATFMDSFVRCYDKVDINVFTGSGDDISAPVLKDVAGLGVTDIASQTAKFTATGEGIATEGIATGTFSIHDVGSFGVKSAAAIVLPPQSTALSLGCVRDTVVPRKQPTADQPVWEVRNRILCYIICYIICYRIL